MNIFDILPTYAGKYSVIDSRDFSEEEIAATKEAKVVKSNYGLSVCFFMVSGGQKYIPLAKDATKGEGEIVDLKTSKLITLHRDGDADIVRVSC